MVVVDLTGQVFSRLTVIHRADNSAAEGARWLCRCACGTEKVVKARELKQGNTKSCGCYRVECTKARSLTHGKCRTPSYNVWVGIKYRCYNPNDPRYLDWGGRGITICDRWLDSFENFLEDMGEKPKGLSLDRLDNDKEYSKENCRWATPREQNQNRRNNKNYRLASGDIVCITEASRRLNVNYSTLVKYLTKYGHYHSQIYDDTFGTFLEIPLAKGTLRTKLISCRNGMLRRCFNKKCLGYKNYGAKGITVCERWVKSLEDFIADVGVPSNSNLSLDRIDSKGNYEPNNVRWANSKTQNGNKTNNVLIKFPTGEVLPIHNAANKLEVNYSTLRKYLNTEGKFKGVCYA